MTENNGIIIDVDVRKLHDVSPICRQMILMRSDDLYSQHIYRFDFFFHRKIAGDFEIILTY